jgi:predicted GNAT family N-acyltransferase
MSMVQAYWNIGRLIVEEEQKGEQKAEYGKQIMDGLAKRLQKQYDKGFTSTNLKYMRQFYRLFEIRHALRDVLTWTHYRLLLKVEKKEARQFYLEETIAGHWRVNRSLPPNTSYTCPLNGN